MYGYPYTPIPQQEQIKRVHGEDGAKAYALAPSSSVILQDETDNIIWVKVTDAAGYATIKGFTLTPIVENVESSNSDRFVTKTEFEDLKKRFDELMEELK